MDRTSVASSTSGNASPVIDVESLTKSYSNHLWSRRPLAALKGVSLQAYRGEIFGLLGPNGAGKTTLIKILLGVVRASGGSAKLFDLPAGSVQARLRVGYLPESLRIDRHHTARTALHYYGKMSRMSSTDIADKIDPLLELVGLNGRDREPVRRFSKGMYQRLGLAQALLHDPDLLILDEPTDGLDPVGRSEVRRLLLELKQRGKTIFLNSHILQEVEMVCDRVAIMSYGQVRGMGTIDELTQSSGGSELVIVVARDSGSDVQSQTSQSGLTELESLLVPILFQDSAPTTPLCLGSSVRIDELPDRRIRIRVGCPDQTLIDTVVDRLRENKWSILGLQSARRTLEDVFLALVELPSGSEQTAEGFANPTLTETEVI